ncbi:MAG: tetratricopeptide repeat protein [Acidobacteriota bacterium]
MSRDGTVSTRVRTLACLFGLLAVASSAARSPASQIEIPGLKDRWLQLRVGEITLLSDAGKHATIELAKDLETMRAAMAKATHLATRTPLPMVIVVFDDERMFRGYAAAITGHPEKHVGGAFGGGPDGGVIILDHSDSAASERILYHELTHYFVNNTAPHVPLWLDEGLAEYYSTFHRSGNEAEVGKPLVDHIQTLRGGRLIPLDALFAVTHASKEYNDADHQTLFYAESWVVVHYLVVGNAHRRGELGNFLARLAGGEPTDAAFRHAFLVDYGSFENELRTYVGRSIFPFLTVKIGELQLAPLPSPEPVSRDETLIQLADVLRKTGPRNFAPAEQLLRAAIDANPSQATGWALLAWIKDQAGAEAAATACLEKALNAGSNDARAYLLGGEVLFWRSARNGIMTSAVPPPDIQRARELFTRSLTLNPDSPRALTGLGNTYLFQYPDVAPGIAAFEKSLAMAPGQFDAAYGLALLYAETGQIDKASGLADGVLTRAPDPRLAAEVRRAVEHAKTVRTGSRTPVGGGEMPRATLPAAQSVDANATPVPDAEVARIREEFRHETALYAAAVTKIEAGDYPAALKALDEFLGVAKTPELIVEARSLRAQVAARLARSAR